MNWSRIKAVVRKDIGEAAANKPVVIAVIVVPLVLCAVIPGFLIAFALRFDVAMISGADMFYRIIPLYDVPSSIVTKVGQIMYIFLNYTFLPLFMIIPLMVSSIMAANGIVGEKERRTLETLLYTPITNQELVTAKLLSALLPAIAAAWIGFAGYFAVSNTVYAVLHGGLIVRSPLWLPAMLLLSPAVSLLGLSMTLIVSLKAKTFVEAQQIAGVIVVPFVALVVVQMTGLVIFSALSVILASLLIFAIGIAVLRGISPRFNREEIVRTL